MFHAVVFLDMITSVLILMIYLYVQVYTVDDNDILNHIPAISLPTHLGGAHQVNHLAWLKKCLKIHRLPEPAIKAFFENVQQPNFMTAKFEQHAANIQGERVAIRWSSLTINC